MQVDKPGGNQQPGVADVHQPHQADVLLAGTTSGGHCGSVLIDVKGSVSWRSIVRARRGRWPDCSTGIGRPDSPVAMTIRSAPRAGNTARRENVSQTASTVPRLMSSRPVA